MELYFEKSFNYNDDKKKKIREKVEKLNCLDFKMNIDELKVLATQNYGLINNKIRKKAWESIILNGKKINKYVYSEISELI